MKKASIAIFIVSFLVLIVPFHSCKPEDECDDEMVCDTCNMVYKPNIYIYPEEEADVSIRLSFPLGGGLVTSIPDYGAGWDVRVDTAGLIDNKYSYLFYESSQPDVWQQNDGWLIPSSKLEPFFRQNMAEYGFCRREIDDFVEYWVPRLKDYPLYLICPQTKRIIDEVIQLDISPQPDNILRLFYVIKGQNHLHERLREPAIEHFKRDGYYVTEWGVILK